MSYKNKHKSNTNAKKTANKSNNKISINNINNTNDDISENSRNAFDNPQNGLPDFLREDNIRDKMGRMLSHPDYDPSTLLVPQEYIKKCTPAMQQFWGFKSQNFDKVIFFKLGKFYEMFYDDAIIGNKFLDLNWMGNDPKKLHVGFPEKVLEEKAFVLVQNGFKVAVIEQVETPEELEERLKKNNPKDKAEKCIKRDLCNVFTKGTYIHESQKFDNKNNYKNKYCMTLYCKILTEEYISEQIKKNPQHKYENFENPNNFNLGYEWNFLIFDVTTVKFYFGNIPDDDENYTKIKTLLYNINPHEVIIVKNNLDSYITNFISNLSSQPQITQMKNDFSLLSVFKVSSKYYGEDKKAWNPILLKYFKDENEYMLNIIYFTLVYLEKLLLAEQLLKIADFEEFKSNIIINKNLVLDYQTVSNLEILETKFDPKNVESGSLFEYMNEAVTSFGMRKLKNWILNPLSNSRAIEKRLNIVDDLIENFDCVETFRRLACKFPDFERTVTKIYKFSIQTSTKAIYFEDFSKNRIQEFFKTISALKKSIEIFDSLKNYSKFITSKKLKKMICITDETFIHNGQEVHGEVINIVNVLDDLKKFYKETKDEDGENRIVPKPGTQKEYDECINLIQNLKIKFDNIIKEEKQRLKCPAIVFTHTKNYKYELEIPDDFTKNNKNFGSRYKLTTSRKGFRRYHTAEIEDLVEELEQAQEILRKENNKFNTFLFQKFYAKNSEINAYIQSLAELDSLMALAYISNQVIFNTKIIFNILNSFKFRVKIW